MKKNLEVLILPLGLVLFVILLFVVSARVLFDRLGPLTEQIDSTNREQDVLSQKLSTLSQVDATTLNQSETAYLALPDRNPAAVTLPQIRAKALDNNVILQSITVAQESERGEAKFAVVEIRAEGAKIDLVNFVKSLKDIAPITNVDRIKVTSVSSDSAEMQLAVNVFWADLPKELPAITAEVVTLSPDEINILSQLTQLQQPTTSVISASPRELRADPFSVSSQP